MRPLEIRPFAQGDPARLHAAFAAVGWDKPVAMFERYLEEHGAAVRHCVIAEVDGVIAGYVTLVWSSRYQPFCDDGVPEVSDLNVLPQYRTHGIGTRLLDYIEQVAHERSAVVGLGVGLYSDYGTAQRMYVKRGYVPDGRGVMYDNRPVMAGERVRIDDEATLMFVKQNGR